MVSSWSPSCPTVPGFRSHPPSTHPRHPAPLSAISPLGLPRLSENEREFKRNIQEKTAELETVERRLADTTEALQSQKQLRMKEMLQSQVENVIEPDRGHYLDLALKRIICSVLAIILSAPE